MSQSEGDIMDVSLVWIHSNTILWGIQTFNIAKNQNFILVGLSVFHFMGFTFFGHDKF